MCDVMSFPAAVEEFMEQYKIVDREEVYTNGAELIPIFRMKQWFEHEALNKAPTFDWLMQKADEWGMAYGKQFLIEAQRAWKDGKDIGVSTKWIPATVELPKEKGEYLVTYHPCYWGNVQDVKCVGIDTFRGKTSWAKNKYQRVIAWMKKPEPWEGE